MLDGALINSLFPAELPEVVDWEQRYPPRDLPDSAKVTRLAPSPTGFVHIGGIYTAMLDQDVARRSGGKFLVRIEDTDQAREVSGAVAQFNRAFEYFGLVPDEDDESGEYGPYRQSQRSEIYLSYARELLRRGTAYLCFATEEELTENRRLQQQMKIPPGYYGRWALWRDRDEADVRARLDAGLPYVLRFRSPGNVGARTEYVDAIRGRMSAEDNYNDVVILKTSANEYRLPTYHFAHAVDDHLMRVNLVVRGEEWLSSTPLHRQLFAALGFEIPTYAHIALLQKQIPGGKRKLSKRKDTEAGVNHYVKAGYPAAAVLYYLRGLANGRLAEMPLADALAAPINLAETGGAGPLVDLVKLEDISADYIATLSGPQVLAEMKQWAAEYDAELSDVLSDHQAQVITALAVEREGVSNPRKDLRKWSDFRSAYGFFFSELFTLVTADDPRLGGLPVTLVQDFLRDFATGYQEMPDAQQWFGQIRDLAAKYGFAANPKEYKQNPDAYPGSIREASQLIRVALTGSTRSPDLFSVAIALGRDEVLRRVTLAG